MLWGCFSAKGTGQLHCIEGRINGAMFLPWRLGKSRYKMGVELAVLGKVLEGVLCKLVPIVH